MTHELGCVEDYGDATCRGPVEYRMPLSGTGRSFPRCDKHWEERLAKEERISRDYPDGPGAPAWVDSGNAGERWEDEPSGTGNG